MGAALTTRCGVLALLVLCVYSELQGGKCKNWMRKMQNRRKTCVLAYTLGCGVIAAWQGNFICRFPPPAQFSDFVVIIQ